MRRVRGIRVVLCFLAVLGVSCDGSTDPARPVIAAVSVVPSADTVLVGDTVRFTATAADMRGRGIAGAWFAWISLDPLVAKVDSAGLVAGVRPGTAKIAAVAGRITGTASVTVQPAAELPDTHPAEVRALWITRWDWHTADELRVLLEGAAAARFNVVYFQVRGVADAYYRPGLEPWAYRLTGRLGQ
ncbi:MAG: Ig-like domain-containing protein, partial [Gemmatimonadetes bacterium]|nr:Ig-like domain-containing protein [Gemmatimonadota bacterium]